MRWKLRDNLDHLNSYKTTFNYFRDKCEDIGVFGNGNCEEAGY
jgi:hypothetical protein